MKKNKKIAIDEQYIVKYNIKEKDGYWKIGLEEDVDVPILESKQEKNSHSRAEKQFIDSKKALGYKIEDIKVVCVSYC